MQHQQPSLAYSLNQMESGWRWSVYDLEGVTVADGADASRDGALQAVRRSLGFPPGENRTFAVG